MTRTRHAVIRADAARPIGSGHIRRCLTLAHRLKNIGWQITFASIRDSVELVPDLSDHAVTIVSGDAAREPGELHSAFPDGIDLLVVDHYQRDAAFETACRGWADRIMVIDDLVDRAHDADLLVDMTLGRSPEAYRDLLPKFAISKTGTEYALLRPEFSAARSPALARRAQTSAIEGILISVGATDQSGVMPLLLEGLAQSGFTGNATVIGEFVDTAQNYPFDMTATAQADDMPAQMMAADLAIGACGVTSWERCCLGLPTVAVITADNQRDIATALSQAGAVDLVEPISADGVSSAVKRLADNPATRQAMSKATADICDGEGTRRIIEALLPFFASTESPQAQA